MIERYSRKELKDIWSEENKYKIWLDVEIAAAEAMEKYKLIPKGVASIVKKKGKINILDKPEINLMKWFNFLQELKIGEIKITFVDLEGSQNGMDIETCKKLIKHSKLPLIFEGGIGNLEHIILALKNDIRTISLGTMIYFLDYNIIKIKQYIHNNNFEVRLK